jgi:hypothetical protein
MLSPNLAIVKLEAFSKPATGTKIGLNVPERYIFGISNSGRFNLAAKAPKTSTPGLAS